jgi:hypothetical protein
LSMINIGSFLSTMRMKFRTRAIWSCLESYWQPSISVRLAVAEWTTMLLCTLASPITHRSAIARPLTKCTLRLAKRLHSTSFTCLLTISLMRWRRERATELVPSSMSLVCWPYYSDIARGSRFPSCGSHHNASP